MFVYVDIRCEEKLSNTDSMNAVSMNVKWIKSNNNMI